jgi:hypothetical protein
MSDTSITVVVAVYPKISKSSQLMSMPLDGIAVVRAVICRSPFDAPEMLKDSMDPSA